MTARYPLVLNGQTIEELQAGDTLEGLTRDMSGLGNVDNTSDLNKPVSTAQQTALDLKANINADTTGTATKAINLKGGNSTTLYGAMHYQSGVDASSILAPNVTTTKKFLRETGDGTNGAAPAWDTITLTDLPTITPAKGGTGVANGTNNTMTFTGNYTLDVTLTGNTTVTLPTSGSLLSTGGALGTPASGSVTNLTGTASININGTVGATTPASGTFTTLGASGLTTLSGATSNSAASAGTLAIRGGQIGFPATQVASTDVNTLDDYEEGTFAPVITAGTGTITSYTSSGNYTKTGNVVTFGFTLTITNNGTGSVTLIATLPFQASSNASSGVRESGVSGSLCSVTVDTGTSAMVFRAYNNTYPGATNAAFKGSITYLTST
jgi:hypothetical protein